MAGFTCLRAWCVIYLVSRVSSTYCSIEQRHVGDLIDCSIVSHRGSIIRLSPSDLQALWDVLLSLQCIFPDYIWDPQRSLIDILPADSKENKLRYIFILRAPISEI
ncbi:hypothetical protein BJY01DRAFT_208560 [Aspergillus pseudoustus]|uniref:Uncharacterized protein n=1 Tax=Aspergillus pseudoustus TaxID=1810923 RepID=A0ABR4KI59_9EURO